MFKKDHYTRYIAKMLENPKTRPVFEEYYSLHNRYPPYLMDFTGTEDELLDEVRGMIEDRKNILDAAARQSQNRTLAKIAQ